MNRFDVFLSHSTVNKNWTRLLASELRNRGLSVFLDEDEIAPGTSWEDTVRDALRDCRAVVTVLDQSSAVSGFSAFELGAAIGLGKTVLPVVSKDLRVDLLPDPVRTLPQFSMEAPSTTATQLAEFLRRPGAAAVAP